MASDDERRNEPTRVDGLLSDVLQRAAEAFENNRETLAARAEREAVVEAARAAERRAILPGLQRAWLLSLGVPELETDAVVAGLRPTLAVELLAKISRDRPVLVLAGGTGCGKTCAAVHHLLTVAGPGDVRCQCVPAAFVTAVDFGRLWPRHRDDRDRLRAIEGVPVLVVDDLGMEEESLTAKLDHLVYQRAGNRRPTIMTANMTAAEFRARYDERVWSRLAQSGNFEGLEDQPDLRIQERRGH